MDKKFKIVCNEKIFDTTDYEKMSFPTLLTKDIANALDEIEDMARYDDFSHLKINMSAYEKSADSQYGIERNSSKGHTVSVILEHQKKAAKGFLEELRGFGLLADVVGSGKTFEACLVLSELAIRGRVDSMLLVVPEQVFDNWVEALEMFFGLGKGVLQKVSKLEEIDWEGDQHTNFISPKRPVIVTMENFSSWRSSDVTLKQALFDVIVVDEAHHLCLEEGEYANAMKMLSLLMVNKKKAEKPYCILLSATPHSGNLDKMFRLWYFIRCKGGNPADFDEKDDSKRTLEYLREKEFYFKRVCREAYTVAEYIAKSRAKEIEDNEKYREKFNKYLAEKKISRNDFNSRTFSERSYHYISFLNQDKNKEMKEVVIKKIAHAYYNSVMRSIMIRQPHSFNTKRITTNYFIFPVAKSVPEKIDVKCNGRKVSVDVKSLGEDIVEYNGKKYSVAGICKEIGTREPEFYVSSVLGALSTEGSKSGFNDDVFEKSDSLKFYWRLYNEKCQNKFVVADNYLGDAYCKKLEITKCILAEQKDKRVIIFFDYELDERDKDSKQWVRLKADLEKCEEFKDRILMADKETNDEQLEKIFKTKEDAILIVCDKKFTEGKNLQDSNIMINFQVTPDPLAMDQRIGRIFRLGQKSDVNIISLAEMNKLEGYILAYYNAIGLLECESGDVTIIAGSNDERMVAVQCPACKKIMLYPKEEYQSLKEKLKNSPSDNNPLKCMETNSCKNNSKKYTVMQEINIYEFKCNKCGEVLQRDAGGKSYKCFAFNNSYRGSLYNSGEPGDRKYTCSKLCAINHCKKFKQPKFKNGCAVLQEIKRNAMNTTDIATYKTLCGKCEFRLDGSCPDTCNLYRCDDLVESISACNNCPEAECTPTPHILNFDENWKAKCPKCRDGYLVPVAERTFATYIKTAYDFKGDSGRSFCSNLIKETDKVEDIKEILKNDEIVDGEFIEED